MREVVGEVTDIPLLIAVAPATIPDLNSVTVCEVSVCEIDAAAVVCPGKMIVAGPVPLLIDTVWPAIPDLELHAIGVDTICSVQALGAAIGSDGAVVEGPKLAITAGTVANDHWGAIDVPVLGRQTLCVVCEGCDDEGTEVGWGLSRNPRGGARKGDDDETKVLLHDRD